MSLYVESDGTVSRVPIAPPQPRLAEAVAILRECEQKWGCECPYCDRNYGESFDEHATETNGAGFVCRIGAFLQRRDVLRVGGAA